MDLNIIYMDLNILRMHIDYSTSMTIDRRVGNNMDMWLCKGIKNVTPYWRFAFIAAG